MTSFTGAATLLPSASADSIDFANMDQAILLLLILLFLALPIWQIVKQNKQVRNIRDMQSKLAPGAEVITGSGLHGVVVDATDTTVDLLIADGIVTRWEKAAVARNISDGTGADYAHPHEASTEDSHTAQDSAEELSPAKDQSGAADSLGEDHSGPSTYNTAAQQPEDEATEK